MKKIGIDLDTTLNNLSEDWLRLYNEKYNDNLPEFKHWDCTLDVKTECGNKIFDLIKTPNFFYNLKLNDNAYDVIFELSKGFELYIVTAYFSETCVDKTNWVRKHLPYFDIKNIIFCNNKSLLNLDYLIDDGGHNIEGFKQKGIVYDMAYNRYLVDEYTRVKNWLDIKDFFDKEK